MALLLEIHQQVSHPIHLGIAPAGHSFAEAKPLECAPDRCVGVFSVPRLPYFPSNLPILPSLGLVAIRQGDEIFKIW
jgi:hypothetical protein